MKLLPILFLLTTALGGVAQVSKNAVPESAEQLFTMTNAARSADGRPALRWSNALADSARAHAELMASKGSLSHQYQGEPDLASRAAQSGAHFRAVAENIALGPSINVLQAEWMRSPEHRANILDPRMSAVGIALVRQGNELYAVEDFANIVAALSPGEVEQRVEALLRQYGVDPSGPKQDARQTCEMTHGSAGGSRPLFIMRWEGSDLSRLPAPLLDRLRAGSYKTAAVGACDSAHPGQAFTSYRVAVLLY